MLLTRINFDFARALAERPHATQEEAEAHVEYVLFLAASLYVVRNPALELADDAHVWVDVADIPRLPDGIRKLRWERKRGASRARLHLNDIVDWMENSGVVEILDAPAATSHEPKAPALRLV